MYYIALATDYDGTLATDGRVRKKTIQSLKNLQASGRRLVLVTGRTVPDLVAAFPEYDLFERIVAENGAVLFDPARREEKLLCRPVDRRFVAALRAQHVTPLHTGRAIVATLEPHQLEVLTTIRNLGLELEILFNKGAVMVLPTGVNKASGLRAGLFELGLSHHNVVAVGDAENDHALLAESGCSVAVANALASLKMEADLVTCQPEGKGVEELIAELIGTDLVGVRHRKRQNRVLLGRNAEGRPIYFSPPDDCILIAGPSGSGKTTIATALLERVVENGYQFCVIDPEGDFENFPAAVLLGDPHHVPRPDEVIQLLEHFENPVVNLLGLPLADRPNYFASLFGRIQDLRLRKGRPHWLVLDEAHHLLPAGWKPAPLVVPNVLVGTMLVTVHSDKVTSEVLRKANLILAAGDSPSETIRRFCRTVGEPAPLTPDVSTKKLDIVAWQRGTGRNPFRLRIKPGTIEHKRHWRKYAHGNLEEDSFYFTGPQKLLRLKAQNLMSFTQLGEGVDDLTWLYHLKRKDYSRWIRNAIQDDDFADDIQKIETSESSAKQSRTLIFDAIAKRYTAAA